MKKNLTILVLSVMVLVSLVYPAPGETFLRLPVRVLFENKPLQNLSKDDFILRVDGEKTRIVEFFENHRSLEKGDLPRNFVLTFNITEYDRQIADGISYFVENILKQGESLLLWSPVQMYVIDTDRDKKTITRNIEERVKKDTLQYKAETAHPISNLTGIIQKYRLEIQLGVESRRTTAQFFLSAYSRELGDYMKRFILPKVLNIRQAAELLAEKDGEKWIINFQDREIIPNIVVYREIAAEVHEIATSLMGRDMANATRMLTAMEAIERILLISESVPLEQITDVLPGANISYNAILFKAAKKSLTIGDSVAPDLGGTLKHFSKLTGGTTVVTSNLPGGLDAIRKHKDIYCDLIFKINDSPGEKKVAVEFSKPGASIYYKRLFTKEEIAAIFKKLAEPGMKLTGFALNGQVLKFSISGYKLAAVGNKKQGFIRVLVNLADENNNMVYKSHRTLKSEQESTDVSLELPSKYNGDYKIRINVFDIVSNRSVQLNKNGKL